MLLGIERFPELSEWLIEQTLENLFVVSNAKKSAIKNS